MIKKLLAAVLIWFCFANNIKGQTVLNPSFENVNSGFCAYNLNNATFNVLILNVTAFGTYENCDIINSICGYGTAQQGDWFIGLSVPPGGVLYDAIAVELSSPLLAGQTYSFSFYQKKDAGYDSNPIDIGYSANNSSMGNSVITIPAVTSTSWTLFSVVFTPAFNALYITMGVAPNVYGWNHLDNLQLTNITSVMENNQTLSGLNVFPNPATESVVISSEFRAGDEIHLTDALGNILFRKKITATTLNFKLQTLNFSNGIYFLNVQTGREVVSKKIVVNH